MQRQLRSVPAMLVALAGLAFLQCSSRLEVSQFASWRFASVGKSKTTMRFSVLNTAHYVARENLMFSGGSFWKKRRIDHSAILVEHPRATFLFDTGLGSRIDEQWKAMPWWIGLTMSYNKGKSVRQQLEAARYNLKGLQFIIPSHLHWDHASGLPDFPETDQRQLSLPPSDN